MSLAPIALFVYNRPAHTRQTVEALRANLLARESDLHIFSDGPRDARDTSAVTAVRAYLASISGFASITVHERATNMGLARSVIEGVSRLSDLHGQVVVIEDDLMVSPGFLTYMNRALDRFREEAAVMQISGHMFPVNVPTDDDAFFLPFISSWGWATWSRAWRKFDPAAAGYEALRNDPKRRNAFNMDGAYDYFSMLEAQREGRIDSWAIRWNLSVFMNGGMVLYPKKSLVENRGFDGSGTHTRGPALDQVIDPAHVPERLPAVGLDAAICTRVYDYFRRRRSLGMRLRALAARVFA